MLGGRRGAIQSFDHGEHRGNGGMGLARDGDAGDAEGGPLTVPAPLRGSQRGSARLSTRTLTGSLRPVKRVGFMVIMERPSIQHGAGGGDDGFGSTSDERGVSRRDPLHPGCGEANAPPKSGARISGDEKEKADTDIARESAAPRWSAATSAEVRANDFPPSNGP